MHLLWYLKWFTSLFWSSILLLVSLPASYYFWPRRLNPGYQFRCVCKECRRHQYVVLGGRIFKKTLLVGLVVACAFVALSNYAISSENKELLDFRPYAILGLKTGASLTEIKEQYQKLRRQRHPDGKDKAQFSLMTKAHAALTSPIAYKNWKTYGHPDGHAAIYLGMGVNMPVYLVENDSTLANRLRGTVFLTIVLAIWLACFSSKDMSISAKNEKIKQLRSLLVSETSVLDDSLSGLLGQYIQLILVDKESIEKGIWLGDGTFGDVFEGKAHGLRNIAENRPITLAIKSARKNSGNMGRTALLNELKIFAKIGQHANIVGFLGVTYNENLTLLLEYCSRQELRSYLENRKLNQNLPLVTTIRICYQISRGMAYLASRLIIHRDLAARNILLADNYCVKISDFGLAKHGQQAFVETDRQLPLPFKWTAPEALLSNRFSLKSDVWSFGILLWEIFSFGETPFNNTDGITLALSEFGQWLQFRVIFNQGKVLEKPSHAPWNIYEIMQLCWSIDTNKRPDFGDLEQQFRELFVSQTGGPEYLDQLETPTTPFTEEYSIILRQICDSLVY